VPAGGSVLLNVVTKAIGEGELTLGIEAGDSAGQSSAVATATANGVDGRLFESENAFGCQLNPAAPENNANQSALFVILMTLASLALWRLRRSQQRACATITVLLVALLIPVLANAETNRFSIISDVPTLGSSGLVYTLGTQTMDQSWAFSTSLDYQNKPLELSNAGVAQSVSDDLVTAYYAFAWAPADKWQLDVIAPIVVYNKFSTPDVAVVNFNNAWGLGDIFVRLHYRVWQNTDATKGFSLIPYVTLPTGDEDNYISDATFRGGLKLVGDWQINDKWYTAINVGAELREPVNLLNYAEKGRLLASTGLAYAFTEQVRGMADLVASTAINKPLTEKVTTPVEAMLGLNAKLKKLPIAFNLSGGLALIRGAGTPLFRTLAGMTIGM